MPERVAAERVAAQQYHIDEKHQSADADAEAIVELRGVINVMRQEHEKDESQIEEVTMNVLDDQREAALAEISLARLANRTVRRVLPESFVIGAAIVVTREPETAGSP